MSKAVYEKLGLFYLGKDVDKETMAPTDVLTLMKNKNFTTHAAIIGMTGSGKTGLGIGIIEEAAIDNIPSIVIDPKGDMGDLCLTDPTFSSDHFEPWVRDEANAKGEEPESYAEKIAATWQEGLESWGQDAARVEKFAKVKKTIYTPGSSAGLSINIMASLEAPPAEIMDESDTLASFLKSTVSSLLSLIGIEADPIDSKEYILLARIIISNWTEGKNVTIEELIGSIINPPFKKLGILPLNSYYPQDDRFKFASKFNAVIASPGFSTWLQGENLDIQRLLYDEEGKAKIAIFSIAHLNDDERMFFVTLLLNKYIAWMRQQSGTSALKTLLYMDEIFGFFPPTKNPPSKEPMLLLLKQARAYGVGVILSTQNPVDLDYKGLSNIGTWFIGRLQTTQDIERVIDGLGGKVGSSFDRGEIKNLLANLQKRTFFLKSAHLEDIRLFTTRWVMSYLKGPLKKREISELMKDQKGDMEKKEISPQEERVPEEDPESYESYNMLDSSIPQYYEIDTNGRNRYLPTLGAEASVGFFNQSRDIDEKEEERLTLTIKPSDTFPAWEKAESDESDFSRFPTQPADNVKLGRLPDFIHRDKGLKQAKRALEEILYREKKLELYRVKSPKMESKPYESLGDFKVRLQDRLNEEKEEEIDTLKERYEKKERVLLDRIQRAKVRLSKEESDVASKTTDTVISAGIAVLGALFGRSSTSKIGSTLTKGSRILKEQGDVSRAEQRVQEVQRKIDELGYELEDKIDAFEEAFDIDQCVIETFAIKPRKIDIDIGQVALVWRAG
ncbi:MAG: DUF87 domain-containing protein [Campylobacterota bacterium]|nr:DUF87 domain-containing protein [Campylobacterota bacterium]